MVINMTMLIPTILHFIVTFTLCFSYIYNSFVPIREVVSVNITLYYTDYFSDEDETIMNLIFLISILFCITILYCCNIILYFIVLLTFTIYCILCSHLMVIVVVIVLNILYCCNITLYFTVFYKPLLLYHFTVWLLI
jgi:hypothetical protein